MVWDPYEVRAASVAGILLGSLILDEVFKFHYPIPPIGGDPKPMVWNWKA
jgi:hypothetical protein